MCSSIGPVTAELAAGLHIVRFRGKPVLATSASSRKDLLRQVSLFSGFSPKRKLFRWTMQVVVASGLERFLFQRDPYPLGKDRAEVFAAWLANIGGSFSSLQPQVTIIWPQHGTKGRLYVYFLNAGPVLFTKVSFNGRSDHGIADEVATLREIERLDLRIAKVPHVQDWGYFEGIQYAVFEAIPSKVHPVRRRLSAYPRRAVKEFAGIPSLVPRSTVESYQWWINSGPCLAAHAGFLEALSQSVDTGARVCRVHGDLTPAHVLHAGPDLWIVDWESGREPGPVLVDEVCFWLVLNRKVCRAFPHRGFLKLLRHFDALEDASKRTDLALSLVFLGSQFAEAAAIISAWNDSEVLP